MALRALHLCAGYGGFELALRGIARTVAHVERDSYAAATLVARMDEARLDQAPIWSDLTTFDGHPWRGRVDLITAGFPCQPFSAAGKKLGLDDDRWLWPDIERIIREVRPRFVFLENVPGVVRAGLPAVLYSLAQLGFDAEWGLYAASDVGAPHERQRFWLVADRCRAQLEGRRTVTGTPAHARLADQGSDVGHSGGSGRSEITRGTYGDEGPHGAQHGHVADGASEDVGYASGVGCGTRIGPREEERQGRRTHPQVAEHCFPPRPDDHDGWLKWEGAQPSIRRGIDGATEWLADTLHLGGNGLVPQCAREVWLQLVERGGW